MTELQQQALTTLRERFDALLLKEIAVFGGVPVYGGRTGHEQTTLRDAIAGVLEAFDQPRPTLEGEIIPNADDPA